MKYPDAQRALNKAKVALMGNPKAVFFSSVCLSLKHVFDESIQTAAVDGKTVWYNPDFLLSLPEDERIGVVIHEVLHPVFEHMIRLGDRNRKKFNRAADYKVNQTAIEAGFKLPSWVLYDKQYDNMTTEQIYDLLPDPPPGWDGYDIVYSKTQKETKDLKEFIDQVLVKAAMEAKRANQAGTIPKEIQFYLDTLLKPHLPWHRILSKFLNETVKDAHCYTRPNRRFLPKFYLPSRYNEKFGEAAIFTDTSCSVTPKQFTHFISEALNLLKVMRPSVIHFGQFDTTIKSIDVIRNQVDLLSVKFTGRGGTDITQVLEWGVKHKPKVLIVFTDGEFPLPDIKPACPVIWLKHGTYPFSPAFGRVIQFDFKE
jgi:predicted metal-dependent peptidase